MKGKLLGIFFVLIMVLLFSNDVWSKKYSKVQKKDTRKVAKIYWIDKKTNKSLVEKGFIDEKGLVSFRCKPLLEWLKNAGIELLIKTEDTQTFQPGKIIHCSLKRDRAIFSLETLSSDKEQPLEKKDFAPLEKEEEITKTDLMTELDPTSLFQRALKYQGSRQYDRAIFYYSQALSLDPGYVEARLGLGNVYFILGRYEEAIESYNNALKYSTTGKSNILSKIGTSYLFLNDYNRAIEVFREIQRIEPANPNSYFVLGLTYYITNRYEEAFNEYLNLKEISPLLAEELFDILYR